MAKMLWKPTEERVKNSNMYRFMNFINEKHSLDINEYRTLYKWSIENIPAFWASFWQFADIKYSKMYDTVIDDVHKMPGTKWFEGARLNFAENLLRFRDDHTAFIFRGESQKSSKMTYSQLYDTVARHAKSLKEMGIKPADRVAAYMPNMMETAIAMLAATSIGATWASCATDIGAGAAIDRLDQIKPRVLFTVDGYFYKAKAFDSLSNAASIAQGISSIEKVIVTPYTQDSPDIGNIANSIYFNDFLSPEKGLDIPFEQLPFDHPLYIMFSSGTTGKPKCLVQGAGGILINHLKELILHTDLKRDDVHFFITTCSWMMWNWMLTSLATGNTLILYDGNPNYPDIGAVWRLIEKEGVTMFGTSASYINFLKSQGMSPGRDYDLSALKEIWQTGSPLSPEGFEYVYSEVKKDLWFNSSAGGTDINGCYCTGTPTSPVYAGELQFPALAMKINVYNENGEPVVDQEGELVCEAPAPSMPLYFWNDPDGKKYHSAYFDVYPGVWRHGDFIEINNRGGVIIYGRSDATLNPGGVRIGTAEIYRQVEQFEEIEDSLVVGQNWKNDVRVILFVKMNEGYKLDDDLKNRLKKTIRDNASPRHVPDKIIEVPDIPYTLNMKKVEIAVRKVIHNEEVKNKDALRNPESLDYFKNIPELNED